MRIGIDARFITRLPRRGIGTYSLNLVSNLVSTFPNHEFFLYIYHCDNEKLFKLNNNVHIRKIPVPTYFFWEQVGLPIAAFRDKLDMLHCLGNTAPIFLPKCIPLILTVHDVMFMQTGKFIPSPVTLYQKAGRLYRSFFTPLAISKARKIITISDYSKKDILQFLPQISPNKIIVIHLGCDPIFENPKIAPSQISNDSPFIFCLGAEDPRKNTMTVVRAFIQLISESPSIANLNLIIVGYKNLLNSPEYKESVNAGVSSRVKFFNYISTMELACLYKSAVAFVYPSYYEGFGIPLLEAFNMGCPVIASSATSIPEVGGCAPLYFNPNNHDELLKLIKKIIENESLRKSMIENGLVIARNYSWNVIAKKTEETYRIATKEFV